MARLWLCAAGIALATASIACPSAAFEHGGETSRRPSAPRSTPDPIRAEALPPPLLAVSPPDAGTRWFEDAQAIAHAPRVSGGYILRLRTHDGAPVTVIYDLGLDRPAPIAAGQAVRFRYYAPEPGYAADSGALILTAKSGAALAVIVRRDRLPPGILPGDTAIGASDDPARRVYTEVRGDDAMCRVRVDHFDLRVATAERVVFVPPGTLARVRIDGAPFDVIAFDAGARVGPACGDDDVGHTSYALLRFVRGAAAAP